MNETMNKARISEMAEAALGAAFMKFDVKPGNERSCAIGAYENIEDSKWKGRWTETIRSIVKSASDAACVCVNPLPFCHGRVVWYRVDVA